MKRMLLLVIALALVACDEKPKDRAYLGYVEGERLAIAAPEPGWIEEVFIAEASNFPDLARLYRTAVIERVLGLIASIVERGIAAGEFRPIDPRLAARLVVAPLLFSAIWKTCFARHDPVPFDPAPLLSLHVDTLLKGLA